MAAEPSTARLTPPSCQQLGRKGRPWVAAEIQCSRCKRMVAKASGKEPEGELRGLAWPWAVGMETARPARVGAGGLAGAGADVETVAPRPPPVAHPRAEGREDARSVEGAWRRLRGPRPPAPGEGPLRSRPSARSKTSQARERVDVRISPVALWSGSSEI